MQTTSITNRISLPVARIRPWLIAAVLFSGVLPPVSEVYAGRNQHSQLADRAVKGRVTANGNGLPGVNILVKGTQTGTSTDPNGNFLINVPEGKNAVLVVSYIGYETQEIEIGNRTTLDITMTESVATLQEAVVTALGIKRDERSLGYSVGKIEGASLNRVVQENVLNGMAGKVAGVTINSTGGTGSSVSMIIRGAKSLSSDNQPLFVVDGVPIANTLNNVSQFGTDNRVDYGNAISGLNPEDIESVSILKGPSAAALYGSRAGNGVVLITTKGAGKVKKFTVSVTSNTVFDRPYRFLKWQTRYGSGQFSAIPTSVSNNPLTNPFGGLIQENVEGTMGAELDKGYKEVQWNSPIGPDGKRVALPLVSHGNNIEKFVQTGVTTTNGVSIANNTDLASFRISYSNMQNKGIIPGTDLFKNTLNLNLSSKLSNKLRLSSNIDLSNNGSNNRAAGERGTNPLQWAYAVSPHIDIREMQNYWMPNQEGFQQRTQYNGVYNNPYFLAHEVKNAFNRDRVFGNIKGDWQINDHFSFMARYAMDYYAEKRETKIAQSYTQEQKGAYGLLNMNGFESNADFLLTYKNEIGKLHYSISGGGNKRYQTGSNVSNSSKNGTGLIAAGTYTLQNILPENLAFSSYKFKKGVNSLYGLANIGYDDMIYLDLSYRTDWSSTLPGAEPYNYPSASLSVLANEIFKITSNDINQIKLRGGVAEVGSDASPYQLFGTLGSAGAWGSTPRFGLPSNIFNAQLKPEIARSYEGGIDINLFRNRVRFEGTVYKIESKNQIFTPKVASESGYTNQSINAGMVASRGIELNLGITALEKKDLRWDLNFNLTRNRTRIIALSDDLPYYTLWEDAKGGAWTYVGEDIGDIYDAKVVTVEDKESPYYGFPILDQTGKWQSVDAINTKNKIGNFNPKFVLGLQTSLSYKGFSLNMTFDWRNGGQFVSQTYRYGEEGGRSQLFWDKMTNPNGLQGADLKNYLLANKETMIYINGNNFPLVGGATPETGGYPFVYTPYTLPYGGVFIPGVYATAFDANGKPTAYAENLGENINKAGGTKVLPAAGATAWSFTRAFMFDASYLKLREVSLGYDVPARWIKNIGLQNANVSVYSRNIILWTAAKIGIDPENAYQPQVGTQAGTQFKQGIERYNVNPWVMPIGFRVNLVF